jgi:hypothetical protein
MHVHIIYELCDSSELCAGNELSDHVAMFALLNNNPKMKALIYNGNQIHIGWRSQLTQFSKTKKDMRIARLAKICPDALSLTVRAHALHAEIHRTSHAVTRYSLTATARIQRDV